jgi:hypothetical protein
MKGDNAQQFGCWIVPQGVMRVPVRRSIAGSAVVTNQIVNVKDAYAHPLFFQYVEGLWIAMCPCDATELAKLSQRH